MLNNDNNKFILHLFWKIFRVHYPSGHIDLLTEKSTLIILLVLTHIRQNLTSGLIAVCRVRTPCQPYTVPRHGGRGFDSCGVEKEMQIAPVG